MHMRVTCASGQPLHIDLNEDDPCKITKVSERSGLPNLKELLAARVYLFHLTIYAYNPEGERDHPS